MGEFGTAGLSVDTITRAQSVIDYPHHEIHSGNGYSVDYSVASVGAITAPADMMTLTFKTPNTAKLLHMTFSAAGSSGMRSRFMEGPTGGGITPVSYLPVNNHNRVSKNVSGIKTRDDSVYSVATIDGIKYLSKVEGVAGDYIEVQTTDLGTLAAATKAIDGVTYTAATAGSLGNNIQVAIADGGPAIAATALVDGVLYTANALGVSGNNIEVEITDAGDGGATAASETGLGTFGDPYLVVVDIDILVGSTQDVSDAVDGIAGGHITGGGGTAALASVTASTPLTGGVAVPATVVSRAGTGLESNDPLIFTCTCDVSTVTQAAVGVAVAAFGAEIGASGGSATAGSSTVTAATALEGGQPAGQLDLSISGLGTTGSHYLIVADVDVGVTTRAQIAAAIIADPVIGLLVNPWEASSALATVTASTPLASGADATVVSVAGYVSTQCTLFTGGVTLHDSYIEGSTNLVNGSGGVGGRNEFILKPDTLYQLSLYGTATEAGSLILEWYEHTSKG